MFKKEITYTDLDGNEVTESCMFQLSEGELLDLQLSPKEGLESYMRGIMENIDERRTEVLDFIKKFILKAYGVRREIGGKVLFTKTEDDLLVFQYGGAFDAVYTELLRNPNDIYLLLRGSVPTKYRSSIEEAEKRGELPGAEKTEEVKHAAYSVIENAENSNS